MRSGPLVYLRASAPQKLLCRDARARREHGAVKLDVGPHQLEDDVGPTVAQDDVRRSEACCVEAAHP